MGFVVPIIITLFESHLTSIVPSGWMALLNPRLTNSYLGSFDLAGSLSQWLFNQTHNVSSVTAGSWVGTPGDYWSLVATIAGSGAFVAELVAVYVLSLEDSSSDATGLAALALIFGVISLLLDLAEYLVSTLSTSYVAHVAEFELAVVAATFGVLGVGAGVLGLKSGGPRFNLATFAGAAGIVLGAAGLWAGYNDVTSLYSET